MKKFLITITCLLFILFAAPVAYKVVPGHQPYIVEGNTYIIDGATGAVLRTTRKLSSGSRIGEELQTPLHAVRIAPAFN